MDVNGPLGGNGLDRRRFMLGAAALGAGMSAGGRSARGEEATGNDVASLTTGYNACGRGLFSEFAKKPGNFIFSPFSIGTAMAMALSGARGKTEEELLKVLKQNLSRPQIEAASQKALATLQAYDTTSSPEFCGTNMHWTGARCEGAPIQGKCEARAVHQNDLCIGEPRKPSVKMLLANALMLPSAAGKLISRDYRDLLQKVYAAEAFENATLDEINAWVSRKTEGEIPGILGELPRGIAAVLLNAIYLKAGFAKVFKRASTVEAVFYLSPAKVVKTPTMHQTVELPLLRGEGYRATCLPFVERNLGFYVALPDNKDGILKIGERLDAAEQAKLMTRLAAERPRDLDVAIPKFKIGFGADLTKPFRQMGLDIALSDDADFSGAAAAPGRIKIGDILHRASIELDENGIKAAAVTAITVFQASRSITRPEVEPFVVDRPFIFFIADQATGAVLFEGRVVDPTKAA
jgi:serpin B